MISEKFNRLQVIEFAEKRGKHNYWICKCDCGTIKTICETNLKANHTKSCGCLNRELTIARNTSHGLSGTRTHNIWKGIRKRCNNPKSQNYDLYGGSGIKVCKRWGKFQNFLDDMGICPSGLTIDRINNLGDYKPSNCRWATRLTQANNMSTNQRITYKGETLTISQWARQSKVSYQTFWQRIVRLNWSIKRALTEA